MNQFTPSSFVGGARFSGKLTAKRIEKVKEEKLGMLLDDGSIDSNQKLVFIFALDINLEFEQITLVLF